MRSLALIFVVAILLPGLAAAAPSPPKQKITGIFSNLAFVPQAGDVVGAEIFLLQNAYGGYVVLVQCADGKPGSPELLPATVDYPKLTFTIPKDSVSSCPAGEFSGVLSVRGLSGKLDGRDWSGYLPRRKSYWQ